MLSFCVPARLMKQPKLMLQGLAGEEDINAAVLRNVYGDKDEHKADASLLCQYIKRYV